MKLTIRTQIILPLLVLTLVFLMTLLTMSIFIFNSLNSLENKLNVSSYIAAEIIDVGQLRSSAREALITFRFTNSVHSLERWKRLQSINKEKLSKLKQQETIKGFSQKTLDSFINSHKVILKLENQVVQAVQSRNRNLARSLFTNVTTLHQINNARLLDLRRFFESQRESAEKSIKNLYFNLLVCALIFLILCSMSAYLILLFYQDRIIFPLEKLKNGINKVKEGSVEAKLNESVNTLEIEEIYDGFNSMTRALYESQQKIEAARDSAEDAARSKSLFLANMSHEIRTPMNAILGMAGLLKEKDLDKESNEFVDIIHRSGNVLLNLVNDILDLSKLEAGRIDVEYSQVHLIQLINSVVKIIEPLSSKKNIELKTNIAPEVPDVIVSDAKKIEQVLLNLLSNAVKFTEFGEVTIKVSLNESNMLQMTVQDTGIGISEENIKQLFQRFKQADSSVTKKYGGTGLGLAIVKQLAELMGGSVSVTSELGRGSSFTALIPLIEPLHSELDNQEAKEEIQEPIQKPVNILLADDAKENRILVSAYLNQDCYLITEVENGEEAFNSYTHNQFDLILMDIQMPIMDGYTATEKIRSWERSHQKKHIPIVALTAFAYKADIEKSLDVGCNAHISKPIDRKKLIYTIQKLT
ncbi:MAG: hypothetical protein CME62_00325 [Halobacteriovoraceae bacterium]|nr:hypothetical protein [Halobacteriovoraceae bacterium]|tara:strand:+ start:8319 stop:10241 length:1923 start_codon:yes stop_codon:yes gene_type:complete